MSGEVADDVTDDRVQPASAGAAGTLHVVPASVPAGPYERWGKRVFDVVGAIGLGIVSLPVLAATAVAVRLWLGRPVLYHQQRIGQGGRPFTIHKFRTMAADRRRSPHPSYPGPERRTNGHKTADDPRHTRLGRTLRCLSLDEAPQLWNVVKGEMSLVGPRPELVDVAIKAGIIDHPRHRVRPGITGPWQLSEHRSEPIPDHLELDEAYVQHVSLWTDLGLLIRTATAILRGRGA